MTILIVYRKGDIVKDPMKSVSFVPKTTLASGASQSPFDCFSVDWHHLKWCIFILKFISLPKDYVVEPIKSRDVVPKPILVAALLQCAFISRQNYFHDQWWISYILNEIQRRRSNWSHIMKLIIFDEFKFIIFDEWSFMTNTTPHPTPPWCGFHDPSHPWNIFEHNIPGIHGLDH